MYRGGIHQLNFDCHRQIRLCRSSTSLLRLGYGIHLRVHEEVRRRRDAICGSMCRKRELLFACHPHELDR